MYIMIFKANGAFKYGYGILETVIQKNLRKHHQTEHPNNPLAADSQHGDAVYNYTVMIITLGLLRLVHNQAIQWGNGEQIIRYCKYNWIGKIMKNHW